MSAWIKVAADIDSNPKIIKAGRDGRDVFLFALRRQVTRYGVTGRDGRIPMSDLEPEYVAKQTMCSVDQASDGLAAALRAGLISVDKNDPGLYVIDGYNEEWDASDPTRNQRQQRHRERKRNERNALSTVTETLRNGGNASRGEERRGEKEEIRVDARIRSNVEINDTGDHAERSARVFPSGGSPEYPGTEKTPQIAGHAVSQAVNPFPESPQEAMTIAWSLLEYVTKNNPESRIALAPEHARDATALKWGDEIRRMNERDSLPYPAIAAMVHWCQREAFWRGVVMNADGLRKSWDRMVAQRSRGGSSIPKLATDEERKRRQAIAKERQDEAEARALADRDRAEVRAALRESGLVRAAELPSDDEESDPQLVQGSAAP